MKKKLFLSLVIIVLLITACSSKEDTFKHYDLKDKELNIYNYFDDYGRKYTYALADITPTNAEFTLTGLFYKIDENDYILLNELEYSKKNAYKDNSIFTFYDNKLYGIGSGDTPMIYEIKLDGKNTKLKELKFELDEKTNPFLIRLIEEIKEDTIIYKGYVTINEENLFANIECSLKNYECVVNE